MYTRMLLWQPFDSTSVVSLAFSNLLEPFACSGIMIGTFDSSVSPIKLFTMLPLAHTIHFPSSGTPCTSGMTSRYANHLYCVGALAGVSVDFHT